MADETLTSDVTAAESKLASVETVVKTEAATLESGFKTLIANRTNDIIIAIIILGSIYIGHIL